MLSDRIAIIDRGQIIAQGTMQSLRKIIPQNIRVDVAKNGVDIGMLKSYGSVIDTGTGTVRLFIFESQIKELSRICCKEESIIYSLSHYA